MTPEALRAALWEMAHTQRWFAGRDSVPVAAELGGFVTPPGAAVGVRPGYLIVELPDGSRERYLIPLLERAGHPLADACDHGGILLDLLRGGAPGFTALTPIPEHLPARRFRGEQSNTSILYGDQLFAKVFRRIEPGPNPDLELHRVLADTGAVAQVAGWWRDGEADLALFLEALPDPADGFDLARSYAAEGRSFGAHAWALGEALATIHSVLAERLGRSTVAGADIADGFRLRFAEVAATVPAVSRYADAAESLFAALPRGAVGTQRVHGDCHLAQALLSRGRWVYVDFEGEPMKPLAERRRPDSPLKDVAGMLRSFDYARDAGGAGPQWLRECRDSFLSGYGLDPSAQHGLLSAFETDKAAYEAAYEARYRPRLLHVPLDFFSTLP